jgi:hypothetical protein
VRLKTIAAILLSGFVLTALTVIAFRSSSGQAVASGERARVRIPVATGDATPAQPVTVRDASPIEFERADTAVVAPSPKGLAVARAGDAATRPADAPAPRRPAAVPANAPAQKHRVIATYFHGNVRCATCRKVEAYAREAVEEGFRSEIEAGVVEFRAVNVDAPENAHFIEDYRLTNKSVVVTEEVDGVVARWAKLDEVWGFVGNHDVYLAYVQDAVRGYLEPQ